MRQLVIKWPGHDLQCEDSRGWYTVELILASRHRASLLTLLQTYLGKNRAHWADKRHVERVGTELAKRSIGDFRKLLYSKFNEVDDFAFGDEIVDVDGLLGLDFIVPELQRPLSEEALWKIHWWLDECESINGEDAVAKWRAKNAWYVDPEPKSPPQKDESWPATFEIFLKKWTSKGRPRLGVRRWARKASPGDFRKAWEFFAGQNELSTLKAFALALHHKPEHANLDQIIERAQSWSGDLNPFARSLEDCEDEKVRELGLHLLEAGQTSAAIGLFRKNWRLSDAALLLAAFQSLTDEDEVHEAACDVIALPNVSEFVTLREWVYEKNPCSFCRESAVRNLIELNLASSELLEECLSDCVEDTRKMARAALEA